MKYFGTDGIRGKIYEKLSRRLIVSLGRALRVLNIDKVVVGKDPRISSDLLVSYLASGALEVGIDVEFAGLISTPALSHYSKTHNALAVMITASHNPYSDNGLKFIRNGEKLTCEEEAILEKALEFELTTYDYLVLNSLKPGQFSYDFKICEEYLEWLKNIQKDYLKDFSSLKVVIDCANGATTYLAKEIFPFATFINAEPNGFNINQKCGSTDLTNLKDTVIKIGADLGIAFDGDGDRIMAVDNLGNIIDGDLLIYLLVDYLKKLGKMTVPKVVLSVMSNIGVIKAFKAKNIEVVEVPVGDRNVAMALKEEQLSLGGETSGHIILADFATCGDGILCALFLLSLVAESQKQLSQLLNSVKCIPCCHLNLEVFDKAIIADLEIRKAVEKIASQLGDEGKVIMRPSGTENLIRITVMAKSIELASNLANDLAGLLYKKQNS